jgi:hypothetical protein
MVAVIWGDACPSWRLTTSRGTPAPSMIDAAVWRRPCSVTMARPWPSTRPARRQARSTARGAERSCMGPTPARPGQTCPSEGAPPSMTLSANQSASLDANVSEIAARRARLPFVGVSTLLWPPPVPPPQGPEDDQAPPVAGPYLMARPRLELGTPRFSVACASRRYVWSCRVFLDVRFWDHCAANSARGALCRRGSRRSFAARC